MSNHFIFAASVTWRGGLEDASQHWLLACMACMLYLEHQEVIHCQDGLYHECRQLIFALLCGHDLIELLWLDTQLLSEVC
jgi:hypothetical protein